MRCRSPSGPWGQQLANTAQQPQLCAEGGGGAKGAAGEGGSLLPPSDGEGCAQRGGGGSGSPQLAHRWATGKTPTIGQRVQCLDDRTVCTLLHDAHMRQCGTSHVCFSRAKPVRPHTNGGSMGTEQGRPFPQRLQPQEPNRACVVGGQWGGRKRSNAFWRCGSRTLRPTTCTTPDPPQTHPKNTSRPTPKIPPDPPQKYPPPLL